MEHKTITAVGINPRGKHRYCPPSGWRSSAASFQVEHDVVGLTTDLLKTLRGVGGKGISVLS